MKVKVGVHFSHFMAILSHFGIIIFDMTPREDCFGEVQLGQKILLEGVYTGEEFSQLTE